MLKTTDTTITRITAPRTEGISDIPAILGPQAPKMSSPRMDPKRPAIMLAIQPMEPPRRVMAPAIKPIKLPTIIAQIQFINVTSFSYVFNR